MSGGEGNYASGGQSSVSGGYSNYASNGYASVSGGYYNKAESWGATISGGDTLTLNDTGLTYAWEAGPNQY